MNLKQLHYFRVLAGYEHFTKAAEQLSITQPSLSHAISELEKELGTYLFEKHGRNIRLTKYGRFFLQYVERALDELEKGEKKLHDITCPSRGVIDVAFMYHLGPHFVPNMIQAFSQKDEYKNVRFTLSQGSNHKIFSDLKAGKVDIAFTLLDESESEIAFTPLFEQEMVAVVPYNHPLARYDRIDLEDTASYPFVMFKQNSDIRTIIDRLFESVGVIPQIACEMDETDVIAGLVSVNFGMAIMPRSLSLANHNVKLLSINHPLASHEIYMACIKNRYLCPATEAFQQFSLNYIKESVLQPH
ncbi:LysR family transcriptional regulator [Bacillus tuaregi]|uniref:LysR family transcriptional regulator n=1 Tax=Bacillus tuaregi TaxID=1816695 RepID=UPI0008F8D5C5|nr:LysR family transcriptional regulator [Bacillus tuaregi]